VPTVSHSNSAAKSRKPIKPHPDFPLCPRDDGRWCKRIKGTLHYFVGTADEALAEYKRVLPDLMAGIEPPPKSDGLTVGVLCSKFLLAKRALLANNEISPRTWDDYKATTDRLVSVFGKTKLVAGLSGRDFERLRAKLAETLGPVALGNTIQRVRSVFKFAKGERLIKEEVFFGTGFKRPSKKSLRLARAAKGPRLFTAAEIRKLVKAADVQMRAMIYLAANCGLGNSDVASLPQSALDLDGGWLNFPRPKTGIDRRCKLWPETVTALQAAIKARPRNKNRADAGLVFITKQGNSWGKLGRYTIDDTSPPAEGESKEPERKRVSSNNSLSKEFKKLARDAEIDRTFYDLRHCFATIAGESLDQVAVNAIMGHADETMAAVYRERISDDRLAAVAEHVRGWLLAKPAKGDGPTAGKATAKAPAPRAAKGKASRAVVAEGFQLRIVG